MVTERAARLTSLKYQRQCIEKGEQNLAVRAEEAAKAVTNPLISGVTLRAAWLWKRSSTRAPIASAKDSHAVLHFLRNPIKAHHRPRVAQSAAFPLDDEAPQRVAGVRNQSLASLVRVSPVAVMLVQSRERSLERTACAPKRRSLLPRYLIIERVGDGSRTAAEWDHLQTDIIVTLALVSAPKCRRPRASPLDQRSHVTIDTPAAGSRSRRGPGLRP
jgi:hypothetical protein